MTRGGCVPRVDLMPLILPLGSPLRRRFDDLARHADRVFFAGLPGVGKSLLLQQLALLARDMERPVCLAQWDVARQPFELPEYPLESGATHPLVIRAAGLWLRDAIAAWEAERRETNALLIGEAPLIGGRLMELARSLDDDAEALLSDESTKFIIPVPSRQVRAIIEAKRESSIKSPRHSSEAHDAPPDLLRQLWRDLHGVAVDLDLAAAAESPAYQPEVYAAVYEHLLRERHAQTLPLDEPLETPGSVYDAMARFAQLQASRDEARLILRRLETEISPVQLREAASNWHRR